MVTIMNETEITVTTEDRKSEPEELRIPAYSEHLWFRCPETLRNHFDGKRRGVFEISPPMFDWNITDTKITFVFKWGTDFANIDIPLNADGVEEHIWIPSLKGLKYIHPSRAFNKVMKHEYKGLWESQHFKHEWSDSGTVITLTISWKLDEYTKPEDGADKPKGL